MKRHRAIHEGMRQVLCARCENSTAFKAALSLKTWYAPVMRQVQKNWLDHMKKNEEKIIEHIYIYEYKKKNQREYKNKWRKIRARWPQQGSLYQFWICADLCAVYIYTKKWNIYLDMRRGYAPPLLRSKLGLASASRNKENWNERKREKAIYDDARQMLCAMCKRPTAFKATLSLKKGYAPVMRQALKVWLGQIEGWKPKQ